MIHIYLVLMLYIMLKFYDGTVWALMLCFLAYLKINPVDGMHEYDCVVCIRRRHILVKHDIKNS